MKCTLQGAIEVFRNTAMIWEIYSTDLNPCNFFSHIYNQKLPITVCKILLEIKFTLYEAFVVTVH